jgi:hypothetical protein
VEFEPCILDIFLWAAKVGGFAQWLCSIRGFFMGLFLVVFWPLLVPHQAG